MKLKICDIRDDGGTQPRAWLDDAVISEYAEAMAAGSVFPPVTVFYDGSSYWLADGFHRGTAAAMAGLEEIEAEVKTGTRDDAIDYAMSAIPNSKHGLREKPEDRHRRIETMLRRKPEWSNVQIAEWCGVSEGTVRPLRKLRSQDEQPIERTGRDGRTINTANIGKTQAPRPVVDEMPLDQDELDAEPEEPEEEPGPIVNDFTCDLVEAFTQSATDKLP